MADWSLLPASLVVVVAERLRVKDVIRLRAVCADWAWALGGWTSHGRPAPLPHYPAFVSVPYKPGPFMILPSERGESVDHLLLQHLDKKRLNLICPIPEVIGRRCVGSSQDGWLVTLDLALNPRMLNPLTREELPLPSLLTLQDNMISPVFSPTKDKDESSSLMGFLFNNHLEETDSEEEETDAFCFPLEDFRDMLIRRIVLSSAPPCGIAAVLYGHPGDIGHYMAFARVGDRAWTPNVVLHGDDEEKYGIPSDTGRKCFEDVFYNKADGRFYAINECNAVFIIDLRAYKWGSSSPPFARVFVRGSGLHYPVYGSVAKYIVFSSSGDLYQIWKDESKYVGEMKELIIIFRLDMQQHNAFESSNSLDTPIPFKGKGIPTACWVRVYDLGDDSILIGCSNTLCLHASDQSRLRANRVYFTEDTRWDEVKNRQTFARNAGIYDLETKKTHKYFKRNCKMTWPPPIWFIPGHLQFIPVIDRHATAAIFPTQRPLLGDNVKTSLSSTNI